MSGSTPAASTNKSFIILYLRKKYIEKAKIELAYKPSVISYMGVWIFNPDPPPSQKMGMRCSSANNSFIVNNICGEIRRMEAHGVPETKYYGHWGIL